MIQPFIKREVPRNPIHHYLIVYTAYGSPDAYGVNSFRLIKASSPQECLSLFHNLMDFDTLDRYVIDSFVRIDYEYEVEEVE